MRVVTLGSDAVGAMRESARLAGRARSTARGAMPLARRRHASIRASDTTLGLSRRKLLGIFSQRITVISFTRFWLVTGFVSQSTSVSLCVRF